MSKINRPPVGLQDLLGSKNFGENPAEFLQTVRPIVDLFPFWASQQFRVAKAANTSAGLGSVVELQVPADETWAVISASFGAQVINANEDFLLKVAVDDGLSGTSWFVVAQEFESLTVLAGQLYHAIWTPPNLFFLPPGYALRGIYASTNLVSRNFELDLLYYQLRV